jgi:hypothetical protein
MSDGNTLALVKPMPDATMTARLLTGENTQMWAFKTELLEAIARHANGAHIERAIAHGSGNQKWRSKRVNASWRRFGYE